MEPFLESGKHGSAIGQHGETPYWQKLGVKHGHTITLKVFREGIDEILEISGKLLAQRFYSDTESKRALGPGGPPSISRDNFSSAWSGWYEKLVWKMSFILDGAWDYRKLDNKREFQEHDEHKKRIDYLTEKYPGVFADIVVLDWKKVRKNLLGKEIDEVDLEYREIGAKRAETVKQEAQIAWDKLHADLEKDMLPVFPIVEVDAFVDHYELVEEENENRNDSVGKYRTFLDVNVRRRWTLQRLDEGPWRITTVQVI